MKIGPKQEKDKSDMDMNRFGSLASFDISPFIRFSCRALNFLILAYTKEAVTGLSQPFTGTTLQESSVTVL